MIVDGAPTSSYSFDFQSDRFTLDEGIVSYNIEVGIEVMLIPDSHGIQTCKRGTVYSGQHHSTMCLYQSDTGYHVYCSSNVSEQSLARCRKMYTGTQNLYFTDQNVLFLGDIHSPLTSIRRYGNRLLAHSSTATWQILCPDDAENDVQVSTLLPGTGCTAPHAAILCNGQPLIVNQRGIFLLKF